MTIPSRRKIKAFLGEFKEKELVFVERPKNMNAIIELNITIPIAKETIRNLTHKDYSRGPEKDKHNEKSNVWKFGTRINGEEIYVKLSDYFSEGTATCISFHKPKFKINYPYKSKRGK